MENLKTRELANFHYISLTDTGNVRENNEDYLGYFDTVNGHVFVVCDGCGGLPCGEKASRTAVNSFKFFFSNFYYKDPFQAINDAVDYAQNRILEEGNQDPEAFGMATTMVLVLIRYNKAYYAHIGDSRIYYFSKRTLERLTKDDSYVQSLIDSGQITPEEAEHHPRKNELTRVMGMYPPCKAHVCTTALEAGKGDLLLLCTDGLYNMVKESEIKAALAHRGYIEDKGVELINTAKKNGGLDNITLQIIKFYNVNEEKTAETPVSENFITRKKKSSLLIGISVILILIAGIILALRYGKDRKTDFSTVNKTVYAEFNTDTLTNKDSVIKAFEADPEKVIFKNENGKNMMYLPVKKMLTVRYYDNVYTLSKLYNTPAELIMRVNHLKDSRIEPGIEIIIP
ncbi:MAG: Stp1/IreP family PP2C-type Ser/Thr phosphatase [Bacteroidales bacterium]|nr:Stp1/IreP family PP2C-type Ser/Thr phosphatase [Bacteroidales bacterium]